MTFKEIVSTFFLLISISSHSQEIEVHWSEPIKYDNSKGIIQNFIYENDQSAILVWSQSKIKKGRAKAKKIKLIAVDKKSNKKIADLPLFGFEQNKKENEIYSKVSYWKTISIDNLVVVFWKKYENGITKILAESFNSKLERESAIRELFEIKNIEKFDKNIFDYILVNEKQQKILFCNELAGNKNEKVKIELKMISKNLIVEDVFNVELPLVIKDKSRVLDFNSLQFADDLSLHFESNNNSFNDKSSFKDEITEPINIKNHFSKYFGSINIQSKEVYCKNLNLSFRGFDEKIITSEGIVLCGLISSSENKVYEEHQKVTGVFYLQLDKKYNIVKSKLNEFSSNDINSIFKNNPYSNSEILSHQLSNPNFLSSEYRIENITKTKNGDLFIICSRNHFRKNEGTSTNYSTGYSGTTAVSNSTTELYNIKSDVLVFKLNKLGELQWHINIPRRKEYSIVMRGASSYKYYPVASKDIRVLEGSKSLIIVTADDYDIKENFKPIAKKEKEASTNQPIRVCKVNKENGSFSISELNTIQSNIPWRKVDVTEFVQFSNQLFYHTYEGKKKYSIGYIGVFDVLE